MDTRLDYYKISPDAVKSLYNLESHVSKCGLEKTLLELVKLRVSQINGCAYCVDMHTIEARKLGETERRLHAVAVWHESPFLASAKGRLSLGQNRLRYWQKHMLTTRLINKSANVLMSWKRWS